MKNYLLFICVLLSTQFLLSQELDWVKSFGSTGADEIYSMAIDQQDMLYLVGKFGADLSFGETDLTMLGTSDALFLKMDKEGNPLWAKSYGYRELYTQLIGVTVDDENNVYVAGKFKDTVYIENELHYGNGLPYTDIFMLKYSPQGELIWSKFFIGSRDDEAYRLKFAKDKIVMVGKFTDVLQMDDFTLQAEDAASTSSKSHGFVASITKEGDVAWVNVFDGESGFARALEVDVNGDVYVGAEQKGNMQIRTIGTSQISFLTAAAGATDAYVMKFNGSNGALIWGNRIGSSLTEQTWGVDVDKALNVYVGGTFMGSSSAQLTFNSTDGNGVGHYGFGMFDFYLAKYNSNGAIQWAKVYGTAGSEGIFGGDIAVTDKGSVYASGYFLDPSTQFESDVFECEAGWDGNESFLLKFDTDGEYKWGYFTNLGDPSDLKHKTYIRDLELNHADSLYFVGFFKGSGEVFSADFTLSSTGDADVFIGSYLDPDEVHVVNSSRDFLLSTKLKVYPNPAINVFQVNSNEEIVSVRAYDMIGKEIELTKVDDYRYSINKKGLYILTIRTKTQKISKKIIIL